MTLKNLAAILVNENARRRFALDNGPAYAHSRAMRFVAELPLAGTNEIDRKALVERAATSYRRQARQL